MTERETRRTGEEPVPCAYFALCEDVTDLEYKHPVMGWIAICERCAAIVDITPVPPAAGWRVRATFLEHGWKREITQGFMSPLKAKCLANVRFNVELWHPKAEGLELEVIAPIVNPGWGHGEWLNNFKKEDA